MSEPTILHGCCTVQLTKGFNTLVDEADWLELVRFTWFASDSRRRHTPDRPLIYAKRGEYVGGGRTRPIYLHRTLCDPAPDEHVDHRNGDSLDNRRENIRVCSKTENKRNVRSTWGRSKYKGVSFRDRRGGMWRSSIRPPEGGRIVAYYGPDEKEAARAYDREALRLYGEFACTNAEMFGDL